MTNTQLVLDFIDGWNRMDWDTVIGLLAEDVVYDNIPMETIYGKAAATVFITQGMELDSVNWEVLSIAENGNKVLTERIDNFELSNGKTLSMPVMGTFEIENGEIKAWRDYFDLATFTGQMA
jgi:limonene-1,2-epoxide hydrolase